MVEAERTPEVAEPPGQLVCVCDLDGTVLRSDGTLSGFACAGLNRLISAGVGVTIASGRSLQAMRALLAGVELELPVIGLNGALISEPSSGRHLLIRPLKSAIARAVIAMLSACEASPVLTTWNGAQDCVHYVEKMNAASEWWVEEKRAYGDPRLRRATNLAAVAGQEEVVLITGFVPNESAEQMVANLRARLAGAAVVHASEHIYCAGWTELQVQHLLADKGHAIPLVLELSHLRGATVLACGDHLNDLGMFAAAHESIAPANAHRAVLAAATVTVAANDEDGVIDWLLGRAGLPEASCVPGVSRLA